MRTTARIGLTIVLSGLLFCQNRSSLEDEEGWVKLSPPEGRFEILMPGSPVKGEVIEVHLPNYPARLHPFMALRPPFGVMCGYADFPFVPENADKVFDATRNGSITNVHGKLITEKPLNIDGSPGRRFRSTAQGDTFIDEEMLLVGKRLYLITILSKTEKPDKNIDKVLGSFRLTPAWPERQPRLRKNSVHAEDRKDPEKLGWCFGKA